MEDVIKKMEAKIKQLNDRSEEESKTDDVIKMEDETNNGATETQEPLYSGQNAQEPEYTLGSLKPMESEQLNLNPFEGNRVLIASAEITLVKSAYSKRPDGQAYVLKVKTEPVTEIEKADKTKVPICASELFNLIEEEKPQIDGSVKKEIGWSKADNGDLTKLLKKLEVATPEELIGKEVVIRIITKKDGKKFLGFIKE